MAAPAAIRGNWCDPAKIAARQEGIMKLTASQVEEFNNNGFLFFPSLFSTDEVRVLRDEVPKLYAEQREENVREKNGNAVRTNFAAHTYNEVYRKLSRHPRLIEPAEQLLGDKIYIHQFKINGKAAFDGDVWQWHQDYGTWHNDDDMPTPRAMNLAVFLEDVNEFNGPLMFIPRSHREGMLEAGHDVSTTSYPLWTLDNAKITELVGQGGLVAPKGPAGSMLLFHCNLVHASGSNMTPWNRTIVYISANTVGNAIRRFKRPDYIAHRDFAPIECLPDDCLQRA
jgi:ectoine hydroxylase